MTPEHPLQDLHLSYVTRWCVAPMHRFQSVGEHSFRVAIIAAALCRDLGIGEAVMYKTAFMSLYHDAEETVTGDVPGPNKSKKPGYLRDVGEMTLPQCVLKVADSIETGTWFELWGNHQAWNGHPFLPDAGPRDVEKVIHYSGKMDGLLDSAAKMWKEITGKDML